jgi:Fe-S oxidoreductase
MFDSDYRQNAAYQNLGIRVEHHTELLDQLKARLPLKSSRQPLTFHDPCYLARGRGVTEEPRSLLQAMGAQLIEPVLNGKQTFCCGAGGGQLYLADDRAESQRGRVNSKRFEQLAVTGATTIAVACPYCPIMLTDAAHAAGREDVRIADVAELLAERL